VDSHAIEPAFKHSIWYTFSPTIKWVGVADW